MNKIKQLVDIILEYNIEELNYVDFPVNQKFGLIVHADGVKYEFIINIKERSDKLIVLGAGRIPVKKMYKFHKRPVFSRITWPFKESTIYYNDPSRFMGKKEMPGGWALGTVDHWCMEEISEIIKIIADRIYQYKNPDEAYKNIIFYGSSMGGFMSLQLAILVKNSIALVEMPQINLTKWMTWKNIKRNLFPGLTEEEIWEKYDYKLDIVELMKREKYIPDCYMILDCSSVADYENQYKQLFDRLHELPYIENNDVNKIRIRIDGKNKGHTQLSYSNVLKLMDDVCMLIDARNIRNDKLLPKYFSFNKLDLKQQARLLKYANARIDVKNFGNENNSVKILECSDKLLWSRTPSWFKNDEGKGIIMHSKKGVLDLKFKCINDGLFKLYLRGVHYKKNSKRLPIYVEFTKLSINDEMIIDSSQVVCHDKSYVYEKEVKDNEIIDIHAEWGPI